MAKKGLKKFSKRELLFFSIIVVLIIALAASIVYKGDLLSLGQQNSQEEQTAETSKLHASFYSNNCNVELPEEFNDECLLEVHFIDVGQGDSILIRFPDGVDMIIDAGSGTNVSNAMKDKFADYLLDMDMPDLDYLLITHPDSDHVNMASILLNNYEVKNIYYNDLYDGQSNTYRNFVDLALLEEGAELFAVDEDGEYYYFENKELDYRMDIYAPGYERFSDPNEISMFCLLQYGDIKILFTGDAHSNTEDYLMSILEGDSLDIDILKVGHHGSNSSTSVDFLNYFVPEYAVISVGQTNTYNHPSPFLMNRLFDFGVITYRTNRHGNIVLYVDDNGNFGFLPQTNVAIENNSNQINEKRLSFPK